MSTTDAPTAQRRPMRADARRNYDRLLTAAKAAFTEYGAEASLEEIARRAGVGIGTLYRHFPTRQTLLEATFRDLLDALHDRGHALLASPTPGEALIDWLHALLDYVSRYRGLSELVMITMRSPASDLYASCTGMRETGAKLLVRAQHAGAVRQDVNGSDLIMMVNGIAWAGQIAHGVARTDQLLAVMIDGLRESSATDGFPAAESPAGIPTTSEPLVDEVAAGEPQADEPATSERPAGELATSDLPGSELATSDLSGSELAASDLPASELSTGDLPASELSTGDLPASELAASELRAAGQIHTTAATVQLPVPTN